jgi:hypothetical protein
MRGISFVVAPIRDHAFFKQAVLQGQVGHASFSARAFAAQVLDLTGRRSTGRVAGQPPLARFQEFLRPGVVEALGDPFLAAQLGNAVFAAQAFQHDPDLVSSDEKCRRVARRMSLTTCCIRQALLLGGSPATPEDLRKRFEAFLNDRCKGKDATKLRFVVD